jgi:NitT/TauT family transport system substrate-binding protein
MGYIQNVQFAPFYVAQARGYYRDAGLDPRFQYQIEPDLLRLASQGKVDFVNAGGDEVLAAAAQGLQVTYVMTQYSRFPSALFSLQSSGIRVPRELRGRSIGVPGEYGASYVGLLVLLRQAGIPRSAVRIEDIGFTQAADVAQRKVDAAEGYAMNEPVQLRQEGYRINEIDVYRYANLAGAGIAVPDRELRSRPAVVRAFVQATLRGLRYTFQHPREAFAITLHAVPALRPVQHAQWAVLRRAISFWRAEPGHPLGWVDPAIWGATASLLYRFHQIPHAVRATPFFTNRFVSGK